MGALTTGRQKNCNAAISGGVEKIWVAAKDNVDTLTTDAEGNVTGINMVGAAVFYEIEFEENTAQFNENGTYQNGKIFAQSIDFTWKFRNQTDRNMIVTLMDCHCGLAVIHEEVGGLKWIWGVSPTTDRGKAMLTNADSTTGRDLSDANQSVLTLSATTSDPARVITAAVPL